MNKETQLVNELKDKRTQDKAFENLLMQYKQPLYWHIRKIVLNHDDADDVLQNTFVKIFKGIKKFKGESKLYTWMYRIATNESLNFLKLKAKKYFQSSEEMMTKLAKNLKEDLVDFSVPVKDSGIKNLISSLLDLNFLLFLGCDI